MEVTAPSKRMRSGIRVHSSPLDPAGRHEALRDPGHHPGAHAARPGGGPRHPLPHPRRQRSAPAPEVHPPRPGGAPGPIPRPRDQTGSAPLWRSHTGPTRSEFEDAFLAFVHRHGLPVPEMNQIVAGYEVDALWREHKLIVELDGREFHENAFEEDRERDAILLNAGLPVLRITWHRLQRQEQSRGHAAQGDPRPAVEHRWTARMKFAHKRTPVPTFPPCHGRPRSSPSEAAGSPWRQATASWTTTSSTSPGPSAPRCASCRRRRATPTTTSSASTATSRRAGASPRTSPCSGATPAASTATCAPTSCSRT